MEKVLDTPKGHCIDGRNVEVKSATPREETNGGGRGGSRFDGRGSKNVTAGS